MKWWIVAGVAALGVAFVAMRGLSSGIPVESAAAKPADIREFVDEQAQTRLPKEHLITMPYDGRFETVKVLEGDVVKKDQPVANMVQADVDLAFAEAKLAVERLDASIVEGSFNEVE